MRNKKGQMPMLLTAVLIVVLIGGALWIASFTGLWTFSAGAMGGSEGETMSSGEIVESLSVRQINAWTEAGEGSDDVEFWDKGKDITDSRYSAREVLDLSSGAVTDTSVASLRSDWTEKDADLYIEGAGNYYDEFVSSWKIDYNEQTGKGVLVVAGTTSNALVATDVGTFEDIDSPSAVDTGFTAGAGITNYSLTTGADGGYIDIVIGNSEADSDLRNVVFCMKDGDGDLEGDELTGLTLAHRDGENFGITSNLLTLFSDVAGGNGASSCVDVGDISGQKSGTYRLTFTIVEANFGADEDFEFVLDDLGSAYAKDYPSRNAKASVEDLQIARIA